MSFKSRKKPIAGERVGRATWAVRNRHERDRRQVIVRSIQRGPGNWWQVITKGLDNVRRVIWVEWKPDYDEWRKD